jgi:hypothetical protein
MKFWKKIRPLLTRYLNGYRQFFDWARGRWEFVHRRVAEKLFGRIPKGYEVHHVDGNKLNNRPGNLQVLPREEHRALHRLDRDGLRSKQDKVTRKKITLKPKSKSARRPIRPDEVATASPPSAPITSSPSVPSSIPALAGILAGFSGLSIGGSSGSCGCSRCGGSGYLPQYSHVEGGVCFRCGGAGDGDDCYDDPYDDRDDYEEDPLDDGPPDDDGFDPRFDDPEPYYGDDYDPGYYDDGYDSGGYDDGGYYGDWD